MKKTILFICLVFILCLLSNGCYYNRGYVILGPVIKYTVSDNVNRYDIYGFAIHFKIDDDFEEDIKLSRQNLYGVDVNLYPEIGVRAGYYNKYETKIKLSDDLNVLIERDNDNIIINNIGKGK